jgi:urease accessory protein
MQFSPVPTEVVPTRFQRAEGTGRIRVHTVDGASRLHRLYQDGCAKIRLPRDAEAVGLEAVLINSSGGLTGGDHLTWRAEAGAGARLTVTTQACERIYRSAGGVAKVETHLCLGQDAELHWLPQETLLFDQGALARSFDADLAAGARLLAVESVVLGRTAMGEQVLSGRLRDRWRVRREGRLVFADDAHERLDGVRAALGQSGGASAFDGKLFARIVAEDGRALRKSLIPALEALRGSALPRVWRT